MSTPNKENIRLWVEALRSGKYKQRKFRLRGPEPDGSDSFCCLGVAADISPAQWNQMSGSYISFTVNGTINFSVSLPTMAAEFLGIWKDNAPPILGSTGLSLIDANDTLGWSFEQIADAIEKEYLNEG